MYIDNFRDVAHAVGEFLYMATKNLQDKVSLLVLNIKKKLEYLWLVFDINYNIKMPYFDRILGNIF